MADKVNTSTEIFFGVMTFISTIVTGHYLADIFVGIFTYSAARVFYYYNRERIIKVVELIKKLLKIK